MSSARRSPELRWRFALRQRALRLYQEMMRRVENGPLRFVHEPPEGRLLRSLVTAPKPMIFDIGANFGSTTAAFRRLFPQATIHAFEPDPDTFAHLATRYLDSPGIQLHNAGMGSQEGTLLLHRHALSAVNSFIPVDADAEWAQELALASPPAPVNVAVTTVDNFAGAHGIERIDMLKSDTQGFEPEVLKGARSLLSAQAIGALKLEVMPGCFYERSVELRDIDDLLAPHGYRLVSLTGLHYGPRGEVRYFDAFYAPD
jgi:FkbM family methyltransferase